MAGDWIKVEKLTPDKPEIAILARKLGVSIGDAFLNWFRVYTWADGVTCPGFVPHLSPTDVDMLSRAIPGTCDALASTEIGWMVNRSDGVEFANWDRHNGKSAKQRALESEKKRKQRGKAGGDVPNMSLDCPATNGTKPGTRARGEREESLSLNSEWKANGSARGPDAPGEPDADHSRLHSPVKTFRREGKEANLSDVDWSHVVAMAEAVARKVPPRTSDDRRMWLRFAVMANVCFTESWLIGAVDSVMNAKETKRTRQAHLVGVLKARAADSGYESDEWSKLLKSIEIPDDLWKSSVLEVRA